MERIASGRVGIISLASSHIPSSVVVDSSNRFSGQCGTRLPISLSTIVIDRVPRVCLRALKPKKAKRKVIIRPTSAASLIAVVSPDPSCAHPHANKSLVDDGKRKPRVRGSKDLPRKKKKSTAAMTDVELQRLVEALESAYHKDATTDELDYESTLKDLELQTRLMADVDGTGEAVSCSSPTMSSVRKRRGRPPTNAVDRNLLRLEQPSVISPQRTNDGFVVRSVPPVVVKKRAGEGKCRLNLVSRIALRKRKQDRALKVDAACTTIGKAAQDIWSEEAEKLISNHGVALDLGVVDWDNLKRGLLSADEESELAHLMKPMKSFEKTRKTLAEDMGKEPSDEEWAAAAQLDVHTLRRYLHLGKASRNKLIQHNLRLVLFQAHKYRRESSSLSLVDLCQEGVTGLIHGVDKFDPKRGHRFSTYAVYWIRNSILRAQTRSGSSLRSPYNVALHKLNIKRTRLDLLLELERPPTDEEVMARLGLTPDRFRDIVRSNARMGSMNRKSTITGEELVESIDDKADPGRGGMLSTRDDASLRFGVNDVLDSLKPREGLVLRQRFGLDGQGERTLGEIGQTLGLSREMVRKYEACALMKLKHPTRMDYLRSYLS